MNFKVNVRNTGATKTLAGLETKEAILSMAVEAADQQSGQKGAMAVTNDMWMAPEIPGYAEVRDFNRRMALKMGMILGGALQPNMAAMQPGSAQAMGELAKEMSKLKGVPVMQIMRMGTTANGEPLPAASEAPLPPQPNGPEMPSAGDVAQKSATSAITSKLGGLGGFGGLGRKKKQEQPAETSSTEQPPQGPTQSVLMETSVEMTGFSSAAIDGAQFNVPAGYKEVTPDARH
jgi:hypothetical protein